VKRNDEIALSEIADLNPSHIILSPGPGYPKDAGILEDVVKEFCDKIPMLGVCLGHQAICEVAGGSIIHANRVVHGKPAKITITPAGEASRLFEKIPQGVEVARYHSLALDASNVPDTLKVLAHAIEEDGSEEIMAIQYGESCFGVQFHPESILTPDGKQMLQNFLHVHDDSRACCT
jgi:anthranilate synthase component 2